MMRWLTLGLIACSSATRSATPASDDIAGATRALLAGRADEAIAQLHARADADGLAMLGRAELAAGHEGDARRSFQHAVEVAEASAGRGHWVWQSSEVAATIQLAFAPDGRLVAEDAAGTIRIWDVARGHEVVAIQPSTQLASLRVSDTWLAATGSGRGPVEVWTLAGTKVAELPYGGPIAFTRNGHLIARDPKPPKMASDALVEALVEIELPSGRVVGRFPDNADDIVVDGDAILTHRQINLDTAISTWNGTRRIAKITMPGSTWFLASAKGGGLVVGLSDPLRSRKDPRRRLVVMTPDGHVIRTLATPTGEPGAVVLPDMTSAAISPEHERVAVMTGGRAILFDLATGHVMRSLDVGVGHLAFHPGGAQIAIATGPSLALWDLASSTRTLAWSRPMAVVSLAFDAVGQRLAVGSFTGATAVWDLARGLPQPSIISHAGAPVTFVEFSPNGILATASHVDADTTGGTDIVAEWSRDGLRMWSRELQGLDWLAFRPGSELLATASLVRDPKLDDSAVTLWDVAGTQRLSTSRGASPPFAWRDDGALAHGHSGDNGTVVQPAASVDEGGDTDKPLLEVPAVSVAFQPRGKLVAVVDQPGRLSAWSSDTLQLVGAVADDLPRIEALVWNREGSLVAGASGAIVRLWDPSLTSEIARITAHAIVSAVAFQPGGRVVAIGCLDGTVELRSVATGELIATVVVAEDRRAIVFAPDGAVDGTLGPTDPLFWRAGSTTIPGLGAWDRSRTPQLLPARLAKAPAETMPRAGLRITPKLPTCFTERSQRRLTSLHGDGRVVELCVQGHDFIDRSPTCFTIDPTSGKYTPRVPSPREQLGLDRPTEESISVLVPRGVAVVTNLVDQDVGDVTIVDTAGAVRARYHMPVCR